LRGRILVMHNKSQSEHLESLVVAAVDGVLSPEQHHQLEELLASGPQVRSDYFLMMDMHLGLKQFHCTPPEQILIPAEAPSKAYSLRHWRLGQVGRWMAVAATTAMVIFVVSISGPGPQERSVDAPTAKIPSVSLSKTKAGQSTQQHARLTQAAGAELFGELLPELGASLEFEHKYVLYQGMLELTFPNGAAVVMKSPAIFRINSPEKLSLQIGHCSVHAPPGAEGFQVMTPWNEVTDLGTRFVVSVDSSGDSDLHVIEGAARIHSKNRSDDAVTLFRGGAVRMGKTAEPSTIDFDAEAYQNQLPDRVISYEAERIGEGPEVRDLQSVTVQRGGIVRTYGVNELIGIDIASFVAGPSLKNVAWDGDFPNDPTVALSGDVALNTGLVNIGGRRSPPNDIDRKDDTLRPGLGIRFRKPVINGPGPDAVLFELQAEIHSPEGDHFWVSPLVPHVGLHSHHVTRFDIMKTSVSTKPVAPYSLFLFKELPRSLEELAQVSRNSPQPMIVTLPHYALAVGIDFSDLGYPPGAMVEGLFIEADISSRPLSTLESSGKSLLDPVFIGGFPPYERDVISE